MKVSELYTEATSERFKSNQARGIECCDVCGRPLKERKLYVLESYATGELVPVEVEVTDDSSSCVFVGPECAKRLPGFVRS